MQFLKSLGSDHAVDLSSANVIESVKGFLKSRKLKGVDVLYDPVGGKLTKDSLKLLNWGAQILVIGFASGEVPVVPANIALVKVCPLSTLTVFPITHLVFYSQLIVQEILVLNRNVLLYFVSILPRCIPVQLMKFLFHCKLMSYVSREGFLNSVKLNCEICNSSLCCLEIEWVENSSENGLDGYVVCEAGILETQVKELKRLLNNYWSSIFKIIIIIIGVCCLIWFVGYMLYLGISLNS